jgi:hypothetical protein
MKLFQLLILVSSLILSSCDTADENYVPKEAQVQQRSLKRGVSFNYQFSEDITTLGKGIAWSYNWGSSQSSVFDEIAQEQKIDYCPMAWSGVNADALRNYLAINPACEYLLAFNEPNLTDQANMTPQQAAAKWPEVVSIAQELNLKIISPAMNYGTLSGYSDPILWLDEFFKLVPISDIEGIAVHCYMSNAASLKSYIERFEKYNKPIWLTEFCAWDGSVSKEGQEKFMADALNYLESDSKVFRYAWFIPRGSGSEDKFPYMFLLKNSATVELTNLGKIFTQMSTQDKNIFYVEQQQIEAEHYSSISIAASAGSPGWTSGPRVQVTTDSPYENLELYNFYKDQWVEYQIAPDRSKTFELEIRYAAFVDTEFDISINEKLQTSITLPSTQEVFIWNTATVPLDLAKGQQTIRLQLKKGTCHINWLKYS